MLRRDLAVAYSNRAFALRELERFREALDSCDAAIALNPDCVEAHCNRASVLLVLQRVDEAVASFDAAIAIEPDNASMRVNRGLARLLGGDFTGGWADYEWRRKDAAGWVIHEKRDFHQPVWLGQSSPAGQRILLQSEQGYGDTIQFCRYATRLAELGAIVILEVPEALVALMQCLDGVADIVARGKPLPPFDRYCPLLSLPLAFQTTLSDVPARIPYLSPGEERRRRWNMKLSTHSRMRVGLAWSGAFRPGQPELWSANSRRNLPLHLLSLINDSDIEFYSLQKGAQAEAELAQLTASNWGGPAMRDFTGELHDFADTAALIEKLDLVISVDTSVAHLAGALGKPVWILNRFDTCWRWMLDRNDSPWYPTARLYRQPRPGDWEAVLRSVRADLQLLKS